ncbi:MAG: copper transporter, partial [Syntrophomonadaceae bacterium]|nr:copper transporter [Syntrophomonadaceae bacterium]
QFDKMRQEEEELSVRARDLATLVGHYENFGQAVLPPLVRGSLAGYQLAVVVTGGQQLPPGLLNTLTLAGVKVNTTTVVLPGMGLEDATLAAGAKEYFGTGEQATVEQLRGMMAVAMARVITGAEAEADRQFLEDSGLVEFNGDFRLPVQGVLVLGGAADAGADFSASLDAPLVQALLGAKKRVYGVESSRVAISYMAGYQKLGITTVDDVDLSPGQLALVLAMQGQSGSFGIKETAKKFMPELPAGLVGAA